MPHPLDTVRPLVSVIVSPEFAPYPPGAAAACAGLYLGRLFTLLLTSSPPARLDGQVKAGERRATELEARIAAAEAQHEESERNASALRTQLAEARTRLEEETKAAAARQALLDRAEQRLADTFRALSADALKS